MQSLQSQIQRDIMEKTRGKKTMYRDYYLPSIEKRQMKYISEKDINVFIKLAVAEICSELLQLIQN